MSRLQRTLDAALSRARAEAREEAAREAEARCICKECGREPNCEAAEIAAAIRALAFAPPQPTQPTWLVTQGIPDDAVKSVFPDAERVGAPASSGQEDPASHGGKSDPAVEEFAVTPASDNVVLGKLDGEDG